MTYIESKNKEWCDEKISEIMLETHQKIFTLETSYDIRLCSKSEFGIVSTLFICHSYTTLYGFLRGVQTGFDLMKLAPQ